MLAVGTALLCGAAFAAAIGVLPPLLPVMGGAFGLSEVGAAWIVSAFAVARLVVDLPAASLVERIGRRRAFLAGGLLLTASAVLTALAPAPSLLYAARAVGGIGHALTSLTLLLFVLGASKPELRSRAGSLAEFTVVAGFLLIGLVAGPVAEVVGWRGAMGLVAALAGLATLAGARLPWEAPPVEADAAAPARARPAPAEVAVARAAVWPVLAASFALPLTWHGVLVTLLPLTAASRLGLDATGIGRVLAFNYAADLLLLLPVATLADRTGGARVLTAALALAAVAAPAILLAPSPGLLAAAVFAAGMTFSAWMIPATLLLRAVPATRQARTIALFRFTGDAAAVAGPVLVAAVYEGAGLAAAATLSGGVPLAAALALARAGPPSR